MAKTILIAGLPNSGKSTFIAALWSCLEEKFINMKFSLASLPQNSEYLNKLSSAWNELKRIDRTNIDTPVINIPMKLNETNENVELNIPDYRGESFKSLITNRISDEFKNTLIKSTHLLYFIHECNPGRFDDDFKDEDKHESEAEANNINVDNMIMSKASADAMNMLVLRWLRDNSQFKKILICISAWDKKLNHRTAEEYISSTSPGMYNFIKHSFPEVEFIGVSAQGCDYDHSNKQEYEQKTFEGKRAYVLEKEKNIYDISLPVYKLIVE